MVAKIKSSVYVDGQLWKKFKKHVADHGSEVSDFLEKLIQEELMLNIEEALLELSGSYECELDFEPVKPIGGPVSTLIREMRDGRENSVLGQ